ncbi:hypothetical protein B0A49_06772 [Cryomyces minteri]|uniref:HhH-GPD domain-containing protein n=1 Tax=Cryomyces minteri TaxID=331657 RepID=A0A4U0WXV4_9PEZI|nr:hypothetical protein B0A49_06772 [Cryomyces minteri]
MDYEAHMQHAESSCKDIVSPTNVMTQSAPAPAMLSPIRNTHHTFAEFNAMLSGPGSDGNEEVHDADGIMEIIAVRTVDEDLRDLAGESASISDGHRNRQDRIRNNGVVVAGTTVGEINPEALEVIDRHALRPRSLAPQPREDVLKNNMLDEYQTYKHHIDQDPNIIAHANKNHGADQLDGQLRMDDQDIINVVTVGPAKASQELLNDFHVEHQIGPRSESQESQNHREEADMQLKAEFAASQESTAMTPEARVRRPSPMVVVYDTPTVSRPGDEVDARPLFNYPAADEENRSLPSQHGDQDKPNVDSRDLHYTVGVCEPTMVALLDDSMKTSETGPTTPQKEKTGLSSDHFESPSSKKKRKQTTLKSPHFLDPATASKKSPLQKKGRIPAGTSCVHFPPLSAPRFGLIQEELADDPFRLLVAVTFLNKTKGEVAIPVYRALMSRYPTPADLARADPEEVAKTIHHLGLQNQRARSIIRLAATWESQPPEKSKRYRTLHYPTPGAGRELRDAHVLGDADERTGAWEVARMPGTGPYAWDSWRIFCRDRLRGLADDYKGTGAAEGFEPEWKRVVPKDKELRACLRWMWLREGWEWDPLTGNKKVASVELMKQATTGRGEWDNPDGMMGSAIKPTDKQGRPVDDTEPLPLSSTASPHRNGLADEEPALPAPRNLTETAETAKEAEAQDLNITSKEPVSQGLYREQSPIPSPQPNAVEAATKPEVLVNNTPLKESVSQEMDREQRAQSVAFLNSSVTRKRTKVYRTDSTPLKQDREGVATQSEQAEPHPNDVDDDDEALEDQSDGEADRAGQTAEPVSAIRSGRGSVLSSTRARSGEGASRRAVRQESDIAESNPHTEVAEQLAPHDTVDAGVETLLTQLRHAALGFEGDGVQAAPSGRVEDGADGEAEDEEAEEDEQSVEDTSEEEEEDEEGYGGREASMELL